jgi:sterol desaturase/sphingolipid hydroxylase (fatty acid hydroxylase superfamily)
MEEMLLVWFKVFLITALRYVVFAGIVFVPCYLWFKDSIAWRKIQEKFQKRADYAREIGYSFLTFTIFGITGLTVHLLKDNTQLYSDLNDYPVWWTVASVVVALLIHDTYFYWTHRLMHHPRLFKVFHLVHHKSTNPTPWASFAFHPLEAVVESSIILVLVFTIPMHLLAILLFLVIMTAENVMGHLGYEFYPKWLTGSFIGKWLNTSTNHNMHHKYFEGNYGLYFRWWDVWMGTTHAKYESTLAEIQSRQPSKQKKNVGEVELA